MQWIYLLPIAAAPLAHNAVSLARHYPSRFRPLLALAAGLTAAAVANRLVLMADSGYPGQERVDPTRFIDSQLIKIGSHHEPPDAGAGAAAAATDGAHPSPPL